MNASKRSRRPQLEQLEEDIREIGALIRGGMTPEDALAAFRRRIEGEGLRDVAALVAAHGLVSRYAPDGSNMSPESVARLAYDHADAMLKERVSP